MLCGQPIDMATNLPSQLFFLVQQSGSCIVKRVSQSTISGMKKLFMHVEVKALNNNFSRCIMCDLLQDCIFRYVQGCKEWATLVNDRTWHINY